MMRKGKPFGTLNWRVEVIPLMGSEKGWITDEIRKQMINGEGVGKDYSKEEYQIIKYIKKVWSEYFC